MPQFVCSTCTYPSRLADCCDNPGCVANPAVSQAQKDAWKVVSDHWRAEEAERERIRQIRKRAQGWTR